MTNQGITAEDAYEKAFEKDFAKAFWDKLRPYRFFDTDKHEDSGVEKTYKNIRTKIAHHVTDNVPDQVKNIYLLDVGTGFGDCAIGVKQALNDKNKNVTATGIDISTENIETARRNHPNQQVNFQVGP